MTNLTLLNELIQKAADAEAKSMTSHAAHYHKAIAAVLADRRQQAGIAEIAEMRTAGPFPPDPEEKNEARSTWAEIALLAFIEATGSEAEYAVRDLVADLMHWCDRHDLSWEDERQSGEGHYTEETTQHEQSHASDCASRQHSASECNCGLADRLAAQESEGSAT